MYTQATSNCESAVVVLIQNRMYKVPMVFPLGFTGPDDPGCGVGGFGFTVQGLSLRVATRRSVC